MQSENDPNDGPWTVVEAQYEGRLAWLRIRRDISQSEREKIPHKLAIRWEYMDDGERGMPPLDLKDRFHQLEEELVATLHIDKAAMLVLVLTTAGYREWQFYSEEVETVQERINAALSDLPALPISVMGKLDPTWEDFTFFEKAIDD